jgi:hypothetical protein
MDGFHFDHFTRRLTDARLSRRATLSAGGLGVVSAAFATFGMLKGVQGAAGKSPNAQATPAAEGGTPTAADPNAMNIDGAWFCKQTFALCTTAPCELSESDPTIANCHCVVVDSYAIGFKTCEERAQSGTQLHSNFSTANVNSEFSVLTCPESTPWANCLDVPCEIDTFNPAVATCQCVMVETGPSLTFGGGCDTSTCTSTIWSAALEGLLGLQQYETGMKQVNQEVVLPATCPSATPVAATPAA